MKNKLIIVIILLIGISCTYNSKKGENMKQVLSSLDEQIKLKRPNYYKKLQDPLTDDEINKLESQFNIELPDKLKELYKWKNGQEQMCFDAFVNNSTFLPIKEALKTNQKLTTMIGKDFDIENWWNKNWIPLFSNGGGDYICYDMDAIFNGQKGQIVLFLHDSNERFVLSFSLKTFLQTLNDYYQKIPKKSIDEYIDINSQLREKTKFTVKTSLK